MMLSSNRILKPGMVNLDTVNKVVIEAPPFDVPTDPDEPEDPAIKEKDAQKQAAKIIRHAERQAEEILTNALADAEARQSEVLQNAETEAARITSEAHESGYKSGMDAATSEGEAIKAEARQVLEDAEAERKKMQESLEPEIVNMIIGITEKLLGNFAEINPKIIINLIKQGFAAATISGNVTVYVSAGDYDLVLANKDELLALTDGSVKLEITKDLSLSPMDCVIETPFGDIDCSLGQQFESLKANLTYIMNNK